MVQVFTVAQCTEIVHELFFSLKKSQTKQFPNQGLHRYVDVHVIRELVYHNYRDTCTAVTNDTLPRTIDTTIGGFLSPTTTAGSKEANVQLVCHAVVTVGSFYFQTLDANNPRD